MYGGAPKYNQIRACEQGVELVVATPGRLNDISSMNKCNLGEVIYLVLDEADRMLDMGFEPQIQSIIKQMPRTGVRQTMMFTATWEKSVMKIAQQFLKPDAVKVHIGETDRLTANAAITQIVKIVEEKQKISSLITLLSELPADSKTLVFASKKTTCDWLANFLWEGGVKCDSIHGDKEQYERTQVLNRFRSSALKILVATDVAARGLDVKDIDTVVNYDFPSSGVEDYVHRIGRTGRTGGVTGRAYTLFTHEDGKFAHELVVSANAFGSAKCFCFLPELFFRGYYAMPSKKYRQN